MGRGIYIPSYPTPPNGGAVQPGFRAGGFGGGGPAGPPPIEWPLIWNVEGETLSQAPTNVYLQQGLLVQNTAGTILPSSVSKTAKSNANGERLTLDLKDRGLDTSTGGVRFEVLTDLGGLNWTVQWGFWAESPATAQGALYPQHSGSSTQMHTWRSSTDLAQWVNHGQQGVTWSYGTPINGWCAHQFEINFATDVYKSRIYARSNPNVGTQDSGWKTQSFTTTIAETPLRYFRIYFGASTSMDAQIGQIWMGDLTDSFPDGAEQLSNYVAP
jgi:hypothetical protein